MERKNVIILIIAIIVFGYQNIKQSDFKITSSAVTRACPETLFRNDIAEIRVSPEEGRQKCTRRVHRGGLTQGEPNICEGSRKGGFRTCSREEPSTSLAPLAFSNFSYVLPAGLTTLKNSVQETLSSPTPSFSPTSAPFPSPSESPTLSTTPTSLRTPSSITKGTQDAGDATPSQPTKTSQEQAVLLQDTEGTILFASNPDAVLPLASLTKLMTAAIVIDTIPLNEYATITARAEYAEGDVATLRTGEIFSVRALLEAMLIASSNDAAIALEDYARAQGIDLVSRMNEKARLWELHNTIFQNTTGLDAPAHHSTVRDLGKLTEKLLRVSKYTIIWEITRIPEKEIISENNYTVHLLQNSNKLLAEIPGIYGGKTGTTKLAKECLALIITQGTKHYILVILGSEDRFKDARSLIKKYL